MLFFKKKKCSVDFPFNQFEKTRKGEDHQQNKALHGGFA